MDGCHMHGNMDTGNYDVVILFIPRKMDTQKKGNSHTHTHTMVIHIEVLTPLARSEPHKYLNAQTFDHHMMWMLQHVIV